MGEPLGRQVDAAVYVRNGTGGAYVKNLVAYAGYSSWDIGSYLVRSASPVPEPSSPMLLCIGGVGIAVSLRCRRRGASD
ncbi:PEP-CTERM sorting domain-containing protein [Pelomonas sp. Root1444]|uniref:PEP-CTERM sorting domain-containing protein n=1 Tax=Pelomonas sp. Root1444 TaxID=1736464 RepID=UPI0035153270